MCMTLEQFIKERNRMCDFYFENKMGCANCPMSELNKSVTMTSMKCRTAIFTLPNKAEKIVKRWGKENPVFTNLMKFRMLMKKEMGIDIPDSDSYLQTCCPPHIFCCTGKECDECKKWWNEPYKKIEGDKDEN